MKLLTKGLGAFAALLPLVAAPTAVAATPPLVGVPLINPAYPADTTAEVLIMNPINGWVQGVTGYPTPRPGYLCDGTGNTCNNITWPFPWIPDGVTAFDQAVRSADEPIIVSAYSQGAQIAQQWLKAHLDDPTVPSPKDMTFVLLGNATRPYGGSLNFLGAIGDVWPQSDYQVIDVARQYEYSADYPNNPLSPYYSLALANALAGGWYLHDYTPVDNLEMINSPNNTVWKVGNTTYVLIPTENLPLLDPLRSFGLGALADALNQPLKNFIDTAYYRDYPNVSQPGTILATNTTPSGSAVSAASTVPDVSATTLTISTNSSTTQNDPGLTHTSSSADPTGLPVAAATAAVGDTSSTAPADPPTGVATVDTTVGSVSPGAAQQKPSGPLAAVRAAISSLVGSKGTMKNDVGKGRATRPRDAGSTSPAGKNAADEASSAGAH